MDWVQVYDPLGSPWLSTLMAAAPIVVLLGMLVVGQSAPARLSAGSRWRWPWRWEAMECRSRPR